MFIHTHGSASKRFVRQKQTFCGDNAVSQTQVRQTLVSVYTSVESDKKVLHWFYMMSFIIRQILDLKEIFQK